MKTKLIISIVAFTIIGIGYFIANAAPWGFSGFSWIGNNLQNGVEQGDPVIGMISLKGELYNVSIQGEGDQRLVSGSAWIGIGTTDDKYNNFTSQNDLPSIGWVHFNQFFDQTKMAALLAANCFGAGDCHGVRWNKKPGSTNDIEGYISGWARLELGPNGDGTPYPDTWVHFKAPGNPNSYLCNEDTNNYYVCVDQNGKWEGYAWSAGETSVSIEGNPGLGWIRFSKSTMSAGVIPAHTGFCATLIDEDIASQKCKTASNFTGDFQFKSYQSGMTLNSLDPDKSYRWICKDGQAPKTGKDVACNYSEAGVYTPQLSIYDESSQKWVDCNNQASVKVAAETACDVLAKKASDTDGTYENSLTVSPNDFIEAKIDRQCLDGGTVEWNISGGTKTNENGDKASFKPVGGTTTKISAQIKKDGITTNCSSVSITVKEQVKWR